MRFSLLVVIGVFCILCVSFSVAKEVEVPHKEYRAFIPMFEGLSKEEADKYSADILVAQSKSINELVNQLSVAKSVDAKVQLIYVLGELRATLAISKLVEFIDFEMQIPIFQPQMRRWGKYPAQEALVKIGLDSVKYIVPRLGKEKADDRRVFLVQVIANIMGKDIAKLMIEKEMALSPDSEKGSYQQCLSVLEKM